MTQPALFADPNPPMPATIELLCGDVTLAIARASELGGATLIVADAPWDEYETEPGVSDPARSFGLLPIPTIREHIRLACSLASEGGGSAKDARLALWWTWVLEEQARSVRPPSPWKYKTGGAWFKTPHTGVGHHWLGVTEPVALLTRGEPYEAEDPAAVLPTTPLAVFARGQPTFDRSKVLQNGWTSKPGPHSAKPEKWMEMWLARWTRPGDLVLDLYPGLGGVARACAAQGRRYVGREIDPVRHAAACSFTAQKITLVE